MSKCPMKLLLALVPAVLAADYGEICASVANCSHPTSPCPEDSECSVGSVDDPCGLILRCSPPVETTNAPTAAPPEELLCSSTGSCNVPDMQCPVGYDCGNPRETACGFLYFCVPNGETAGPTKSPTETVPDEDIPTPEPTANPTRRTTDAPTDPQSTASPTENLFTAQPTAPTPPPSRPPTLSEDELNPFPDDDASETLPPVHKNIDHTDARANSDNAINAFTYVAYLCAAGVLIVVALIQR
jgi:hypothetical protein